MLMLLWLPLYPTPNAKALSVPERNMHILLIFSRGHRHTLNINMFALQVQSPQGICMVQISLDLILREAIRPSLPPSAVCVRCQNRIQLQENSSPVHRVLFITKQKTQHLHTNNRTSLTNKIQACCAVALYCMACRIKKTKVLLYSLCSSNSFSDLG